jgi:tetratricopeptide (TPR) repeat protein
MALMEVLKNTTNPDAWLSVANVMYLKGNYQEAVEAYGKALALSPGYEVAKTNRAITLARLNPPEVARPAAEPEKQKVAEPQGGFIQKLKQLLGF